MIKPFYSDAFVANMGTSSALAVRNAAKTLCPSGHPYSVENTYVRPTDEARICRQCQRDYRQAHPTPSRKKPPRLPTPSLPTGDNRADAMIRIDGSCWTWIGSLGSNGYGSIQRDGKRQLVHRHFYGLLVGPIPEGLVLDHLCRNRACCDPAHLEPVTFRENVLRGVGTAAIHARKTHCYRGHPLVDDNLLLGSGYRQCKTCSRAYGREKYRKKRAALAAKREVAS